MKISLLLIFFTGMVASAARAQILWEIPDTNGWNIRGLALDASGNFCIVNTGRDYRTYSVFDGKLIATYGPAAGDGVAIDSGGSGLAAIAERGGKIKLVNVYFPDNYSEIPAPLISDSLQVQSIDWSRNSNYIVAGYDNGLYHRFVVLWDLSRNDPKIAWELNFDSIYSYYQYVPDWDRLVVDFSPTSEYVGVKRWGGGYAFVFDLTGNLVAKVVGDDGALPFSPDGHHFWGSGYEYDLRNPTYSKPAFVNGFLPSAYIAPERMLTMVLPDADFFEIDDFNVGRIRVFAPVDTPMYCLSVSADGGTAVSGGRALIFWDLSRYAGVSSQKLQSPTLRAFEDDSRITAAIPQGESGRVFIYRSDGRCYFSADIRAGESRVTTDVLPYGDYFVIFQPTSGERSITKVSIF